ncbi:MAG TPA: hypothetical protein VNP04_00075 [Alphaproteobacteria bacterium]|nr:hypothetical protein [Alphaproteobacteria bacterium]
MWKDDQAELKRIGYLYHETRATIDRTPLAPDMTEKLRRVLQPYHEIINDPDVLFRT